MGLFSFLSKAQSKEAISIHNLEYTSITGETVSMKDFEGKHVLIVNVASECGFTPQYEELEQLSQEFKDQLVVLGFPCNQFGGQEPGNNEEIQTFCKVRFGVNFPLGEKVEVKSLYKESEEDVYGYLDPYIVNKKLKKHSEIEVTTIDDIILSKNLNLVNLLKIDVEGFEYEVLLGCKDALKKDKIKKIIIELHPSYLEPKGKNEELIYTFLNKHGFKTKKIQEKITAGVSHGVRTYNLLALKD